ncbi:MAG TPA: cache domain-containing protein, partial [Gammaproteobacteria bacterium]
MRLSLFSSLRIRLLLLLLLVIVPACGLMLYSAWELHEKETRNIQNVALRQARRVLLGQQEFFAGARQLLPTLAELPAVRSPGDGRACGRFFAQLLARHPQYANIGLIGPDGLTRCSGLPLDKTVQLNDRRYFREALETRDFVVGDYQIGRITGRSSVNFGYPVLNSQGDVEGVVFAALDLAWLSRHLTSIPLPEDTAVTILDETGKVLAHQPDAGDWIGRSIGDAPITRLILEAGGEGTAEAADANGVPRLYAYTPLSTEPGNSVYVSVGVPRAVAYAELNRIFQRNVVLLLLFVVTAVAAAWIGSSLFVLRPFEVL